MYISTNKLEHCDIKSECTLLRQPIWHNTHIQYKRKTLYFNKLIEKNIIVIKYLKFVNGILDETSKLAENLQKIHCDTVLLSN